MEDNKENIDNIANLIREQMREHPEQFERFEQAAEKLRGGNREELRQAMARVAEMFLDQMVAEPTRHASGMNKRAGLHVDEGPQQIQSPGVSPRVQSDAASSGGHSNRLTNT